MWLADATVHTTGINWDSVSVIVCAIVGALAIILGGIARYLSGTITDAINQFRIDVVAKMDLRLSLVEQALSNLINTQGRDKMNDQWKEEGK
jgi:hypothetical protein